MITIRRMREEERVATISFVGEIMRKQYGCIPNWLPQVVYLGVEDRKTIGAIALYLSTDEPLPLEHIYSFDYSTFPAQFRREQFVQFGRLASVVPGVSHALLYAAVLNGLHEGRVWALGEVKPGMARWYSRAGLRVHQVSGELIWANIPPDVLSYYSVLPRPIPAVLSLAEMESALHPLVASSIEFLDLSRV